MIITRNIILQQVKPCPFSYIIHSTGYILTRID